MSKKDLNKTVTTLLEKARECLDSNKYFLFSITMEQYETQINLMRDMKKQWEEEGLTVNKRYGKGIAAGTHPLIQEYNKTARAAASSATMLLKIIDKSKLGEDEESGLKSLIDDMNKSIGNEN